MTQSQFLIEELKLSHLLLVLCKVWLGEDWSGKDYDVLQAVAEIVRGKFNWFQEKKKKLCDDIQLLKYSDNPSVGMKNDNYMFSFIECLDYSYDDHDQWSPTIDDFLDIKNIRRRFYPLHTQSNHMFDKENINDLLEWDLGINSISEAKESILEDHGKTTLIDVINLVRRALDGEICCGWDDSDPNWNSCDLSLYNVDTRYFMFYREDVYRDSSYSSEESRKYLEKCMGYEIDKINGVDNNRNGFIWVGTPSHETEYGRLFYKGDWDICEDYWKKTFHGSVYNFSTIYDRLV